jgi:sterol desaturase/sphingolipid hydroxylase (fatty acid hydroxylase superfamily)
MHLPKERRVEKAGIFYRLNGHHLLHHRYMHRNFNVVLPLADLILGTLMVRSKVKFAQATGPQVPDVQPMGKEMALGAS